ncbi:MAG: hypothetical protein NOU37_07320 [Candidatus Brocadiales bacterium]|nr:hypothetical protein [Candidatus Bathyanammoxibius amoris]
MRWAIFLILTLLPSLSFAQGEWGGPLQSLSQQERVEMVTLIFKMHVYDLDQAKHKKFWEIADSHKWSEKELPELFDRLFGRGTVRQRYMLRAVLSAYEKKKDTKSTEFQEYEAKLVKLEVIAPEEIKESDEFIYKVAHGEPVVIEGLWGDPWAEPIFNDHWAENYRANLDIIDKYHKQSLQLFDRNWKGE